PPDRLGDYLRGLRKLLDDYGYSGSLYGHFAGGCVHTRIDFGLKSRDGIRKFRSFIHDAADLVLSHGGSLSGEHGDGQSRGELLPKMFGPELVQAFGEFKTIWDPQNRMNPHKVIDPYRTDQNLRYGPDYNPPQPDTYFSYPDDHGSLAYAMERCVGVGQCRQTEGGTMCPSYMVTLEEKHSTRGRARLFWEMLNGGVLKHGWHSKEVKESLDLCLACKGCKSDCPVHVDMATYKAEFMAHYYKGRLRPRSAYAMGLIYWWARIASHFPRVANFFSQRRPFCTMMKWMGGIAQERRMPAFAQETLRHWFKNRPKRNRKKPRVMLWPDTFTNFFKPEVGKAAVEVLEAAGFQVVLPEKMLCCGRPLYDFGMLSKAKGLLEEILRELREELSDGTPIVGLEPSCVSVFRDELKNFFPTNEDARRLRNSTYTLAEFLAKKAPDFEIPKLAREALLHGHCHHKAIMKMDCDQSLFHKAGLDFGLLDSGCCGMAGSFGFEDHNYNLSVKCGERVLLPAVRDTDERKLIVTDGFSCREQIEQLTGRKVLHTAEVLRMALREERAKPREPTFREIERDRFREVSKTERRDGVLAGVVGSVVGALTGLVAIFWKSKNRH
ncbi:MAG: FAD-binding and (Fe-S)-binding domain-containing protein, partial [Limisphaerales bacterium]